MSNDFYVNTPSLGFRHVFSSLLLFLLLAGVSCRPRSTRIPEPQPSSEEVVSPADPQGVMNDVLVDSVEGFREAVQQLQPGDRLLLQDGIYQDVGNLTFSVKGSAELPVLIQPLHPHQVQFRGELSWRIDGQQLHFSGLDFIEGRSVPTDKPYASFIYASPSSDSIRFSGCRFIRCEMELKENGKTKGRLVTLHGDHHRFDHCVMYDLIGGGLAMKGPEKLTDPAYKGSSRVDHNIFREMTRHRALKDQGEALFLGTGFEHRGHRRMGTVVEFNIFDRAVGDTHGEIITVKGSEIIFRNNLFVNAPGAWFAGGSHLSLRSTDHCVIHHNLFQNLGCGIWVTGKGHQIFNNLFLDIDHAGLLFPSGNIAGVTLNEGVTMVDGTYFDINNTADVYGKLSRGYGAAFRAAEDCVIVHNAFSDLKRYAVIAQDKQKGGKGSLPIRNNVIANNVFAAAVERRNDPFMHIRHPDKNQIQGNVYHVESGSKAGALGEDAILDDRKVEAQPVNAEAQLRSLDTGAFGVPLPKLPKRDFWGQPRDQDQPVAGPLQSQALEMELAQILPPVPPMPGSLREEPLKAAFEQFPAEVRVGEYLMLDAAHSAGEIRTYRWDFGDGAVSEGPGNAIAHRWQKAGLYELVLQVQGPGGEESEIKKTIHVLQAP